MKRPNNILLIVLFLTSLIPLQAQRPSVRAKQLPPPLAKLIPLRPVDSSYSFIRYDRNQLHLSTDSTLYNEFFRKWHRLSVTGQGNISIVHIGGSHVQGGTLPNTIRRQLLLNHPTLVADRGMIFPYSAAARCNNPSDYKVHCPQKMALTRNVYKDPQHPLGLCGIAVTASDSLAHIDMLLTDGGIDYATSQVILFGYSEQGVVPQLSYDGREIAPSYVDAPTRRFVFNLSAQIDSFRILLPCQQGQSFTLTGVYLGNHRSGFTYHSIGVNGAAVPDYIKCPYLTRDLRLLRPDMVVFGIGINDASGPHFDTAIFRRNYMQLIDSIRSVSPQCAFLFITNNDSYRRVKRRTYVCNANGAQARDVFYRLAEATGGAVWDQFDVMGGLKSVDQWRLAKLAQYDRVHFTRAGYELIGTLFSNALFQAVNDYALRQSQQPISTQVKPEPNPNQTRTQPNQTPSKPNAQSKSPKSDDERSIYLSY